jgi:hypothetical protein
MDRMELFAGQVSTFMMLILVDYYLLRDQISIHQSAKKRQLSLCIMPLYSLFNVANDEHLIL